MSTSAAIGLGLAVVLFGVSLWVHRQRRIRRRFTTRASRPAQVTPVVMPNASRELVYVENDATVRELTEADKKYVDTAFLPFDGARPYVKESYDQRNGWGELRGYLPRNQVPAGTPINPAPADALVEPQTPEAVATSIFQTAHKYRPEDQKLRFKLPPSSD